MFAPASSTRGESSRNAATIGIQDSLPFKETRMSQEVPRVAGRAPKAIELAAGKQYAFCTCGRSENQPLCDGSHKVTPFTPHVFRAEKSGEAWLCMCKHTGNVPFCDGTHKTLD
jgi:CDGSH-type Zn-finger protein